MSIELKIPTVGESITEVQIAEWLKHEGDAVQKDEPVAVIDSEKTTFELPATDDGTLTKILHQAGETIHVGEAIAEIEPDNGHPTEQAKPAPVKPETQKTTEPKQPKVEPFEAPLVKSKEEQNPPVHRMEVENVEPVDLQNGIQPEPEAKQPPEKIPSRRPEPAPEKKTPTKKVEPASSGTRMSREPADLKALATEAGEEEIVPMTMLRRTVAKRLVEAKQQMAMLTTFNEVDMSAVQTLRKTHQEAFEKKYEVKLGLMSFFVKAAIDALKQFPQLNAEIRENNVVYRNYFDVGVAIATDRGLVVPVLRRAERLSFAEVEKTIGDFSQRARDNALKPQELEGGTFTITNGGVFGSLLSTPIINPPQTGILGLHTIQERPVAVDGQVVIRPMMYLALTYDHRLVDGREAVLFLKRIKEAVENPARMLIEV